MPHYLVELSYTKEAIKTLDEHPHNRLKAARPAYEELGITIREELPGLRGLRRSIAY